MLEVIALWFLTKDIEKKALLKGQKPGKWKLITILAWFGAELFGFLIAVQIFGTGNIIGLFLIAMMCAVGSYLFVKAQLEKMPDQMQDDIENIGKW